MSMRRKSERNKAKGSPEKKVEKPTRKSTRVRRAKRSPSTSPEQEAVEEASTSAVSNKVPVKEEPVETCPQKKEVEPTEPPTEKPVQPAEPKVKLDLPEDEDENNDGSVWTVSRADASPGEIEKLKLYRQRNTSEASSSDTSQSRKKSNKWQESGGDSADEADSAEEQAVSSKKVLTAPVQPNDPPSACPGQDSNEEVSDSKEILPETTSANLSDDKPNIDQQGESNEANRNTNQNVDSEPSKSSETPLAPSSNGDYVTEESAAITPKEEKSEEDASEKMEIPEKSEKSEQSEKVEKSEKSEVFSKEASVENPPKSTNSEEDDDDKEKGRGTDSTSESNDETHQEIDSRNSDRASRASRRKHRNKYRDSSYSQSEETPDDSEYDSSIKGDASASFEPEEKDNADASHEQKKCSESPKTQNNSVANNTQMEVDHIETNKQSSDNVIEKPEHTGSTSTQAPVCKPVKVNLKRSFSTRMLAEKNDVKKEDAEADLNNEQNQNKYNCQNTEQEPKSVPRKRRWGMALSTDTAPSFSVSTDSLKALVPGAKPVPINEVRLSKDDDEERDRYRGSDKWPSSNESTNDNKINDESLAQKNGAAKKGDGKIDNHIAARRKISIVKESPHMKSPSPPATKPTNILLIKNLVRPFTLNQIKELLSRTGTIVENGFWMDRIKSKCYVEYTNEDQAFETRQALHGISWPISNPKRLHVEYAMKDDMELAYELSKDQPIQRKTEPLVPTDSWQQDWGREERTNTTKVTVVREWDLGKEDGQQHVKEKERDKKEDKKRRQRSRSPTMEAHLPAPARKFKKKEDEPPPAKLLDDLFRKTKATPCIYWLPLTNEQIVVKEEMRRQHMAEHARRLEEMRRAERNRDGRRRRSPRK